MSTCGHCGAADVGSYYAGYASMTTEAGTWHLCHPNEVGRMDCYRLVTVYKHATPCPSCRKLFPAAGPVDARAR